MEKVSCDKIDTGDAIEVVTNYYTQERWYLINVNGGERYVTEKKYRELTQWDGPKKK